jgi:hypothetical protein
VNVCREEVYGPEGCSLGKGAMMAAGLCGLGGEPRPGRGPEAGMVSTSLRGDASEESSPRLGVIPNSPWGSSGAAEGRFQPRIRGAQCRAQRHKARTRLRNVLVTWPPHAGFG